MANIQSLWLCIFSLITTTILINSQTSTSNQPSEGQIHKINNLLSRAEKFSKFYRHSDILVKFNQEFYSFQCVVNKGKKLIYNTPAFIIPESRLICEHNVFDLAIKYSSKDKFDLTDAYLSDFTESANKSANIKYHRFLKLYVSSVSFSLKLAVLNKYQTQLPREMNEIKDLLQILEMLKEIELTKSRVELNDVVKNSIDETQHQQSNLLKSQDELIKKVSLALEVSESEVQNYVTAIIKYGFNGNTEQLVDLDRVVTDYSFDSNILCISESLLFCRSKEAAGDAANSIGMHADKYITQDRSYRYILSFNNPILEEDEEYFVSRFNNEFNLSELELIRSIN